VTLTLDRPDTTASSATGPAPYLGLNQFQGQLPKVSIVTPIYNEVENVELLVKEILDVVLTMNVPTELILVDDGSTDKPTRAIQTYIDALPGIVNVIELARNYGQSAAMAAGLAHARGEVVVTLDGDLQNDPKDIPMLIQRLLEDDYDMVTGWRQNRQDAVVSRKLPSWIANRIIGAMTGLKFTDYGCSLKVYRHDLAKSLRLYGELHRFIPFLASMEGARMAEFPVNHRARMFGKSKYNLSRTLKVILDLMSLMFMRRFFTRPLHMFGRLGMYISAIGVIGLTYLGVDKLILHHNIGDRPLLLISVMLVITGVQMLSTGILAEMQVHSFFNTGDRSPFKVRRIHSGPTD
jgi:glycosyltransferase involved in cell wall biosynthesis